MSDKERDVEQALASWKASLDPKLELGGLYARNPTAHKWKAPFRSLMLRETVFWRLQDLLAQSLSHERIAPVANELLDTMGRMKIIS